MIDIALSATQLGHTWDPVQILLVDVNGADVSPEGSYAMLVLPQPRAWARSCAETFLTELLRQLNYQTGPAEDEFDRALPRAPLGKTKVGRQQDITVAWSIKDVPTLYDYARVGPPDIDAKYSQLAAHWGKALRCGIAFMRSNGSTVVPIPIEEV